MGLFDGIVQDLEKRASGILTEVEDLGAGAVATAERAVGMGVTPAAGVNPRPAATGVNGGILADLQSKTARLKRWTLVLESQDKSMNAKDGAANLTQAVHVWTTQTCQRALDSLAKASVSLADDDVATANDDFDQADSYAQKIADKIQEKWSEFAAKGTPGVLDYVAAPVTGAPAAAKAVATGVSDAARTVTTTATRAASSITGAVAKVEQIGENALDKTGTYLKYGAIGLGGLLVYLIYTAGKVAPAVAPAVARAYMPLPNPRRRRRRQTTRRRGARRR